MNNNHHKTTSSHNHRGGSHGTTGQACAACKYQRRKCASDCILAPYFPHDRQRQFLNAHKLFGVSNITKIIKKLEQPQKDEAMRTIIFQSDVRAHDPVGGCYRVIRELQRQIDFCQTELNIVLHQLALCRAQAHEQTLQQMNPNQISLPDNNNNNNNDNDNDHDDHSSTFVDPNCDLVISNIPNGPAGPSSCDHDPSVLDYSSNDHDHNGEAQLQQEDQQFDIFGRGISGPDDEDHVVPFQEIDSWGMRNISGPASLEVKQPSSSLHDECDDMKRLLLNDLDIPTDDDQHNFRFEFEETFEPPCRDEIIYNEEKALIKEEDGSFQHSHQDHDLKGAATLFTLTNCTSY